MDTFTDRVAVVTGAGSGIGRALAIGLAVEGCKVVLADIEPGPLDESAELVTGAGAEALPVVTDVADAVSVDALAAATTNAFGQVNIVCNNAGVGGGGLIKDQQLVDWRWILDVNLSGVIHGVQSFLRHLRAADEAHIMSTASVAGLVAGPGLGPYNATKAAVVSLMETLHHEMAADTDANVGVSVLCPGEVRTNIVTSQRNRPDRLKRAKVHDRASDARRRNSNIANAVAAGLDPADVATQVIQAMRDRQFWVLTHPAYLEHIERRNQQLHALTNPGQPINFTSATR